jgi:hypothetical protein
MLIGCEGAPDFCLSIFGRTSESSPKADIQLHNFKVRFADMLPGTEAAKLGCPL